MSWRLKYLAGAIVELLALICLPFGATAPRFVLWLRGKLEGEQ